MKLKKIAALLAVVGISAPAFATNGMNMEGYGPVATAMGGASFAYDNGTAGMINNPATLGMMQSGTARFDIALGGLHPSVTANSQDSSADAFYMPAFGYVRKSGKFTYGVGMMAQGGMGTEYSDGNFWGTLNTSGVLAGGGYADRAAAMAIGRALRNRSEVGVGRLIFPLALDLTEQFTVGGSVDYVWAGMDIQWLVDGSHFMNMMPGQSRIFGAASGSLVTAVQGAIGVGGIEEIGYGYFDFTDSSKFSQKAKGNGWAGNIGFTWKASPNLTIGGVYHAKTKISDMKTGTSDARLVFGVRNGGADVQVPLTGQMIIRNFQWPETYGFGLAYKATEDWQFVFDYKRINWADVMKNFNMTFISDGSAGNGGFANRVMDLTYYQDWKNQNVFMVGGSYMYSSQTELRFGVNIANNPVPNHYASPLFPAIVKNHVTMGLGHKFSDTSSLDFSLVHVPKVTVTNNWSAVSGTNQTISMSQTNWQLMYSHRF